ncbi:MAG: hypothetical protein RIB59_05625 [Rhodospirillales bacterium]
MTDSPDNARFRRLPVFAAAAVTAALVWVSAAPPAGAQFSGQRLGPPPVQQDDRQEGPVPLGPLTPGEAGKTPENGKAGAAAVSPSPLGAEVQADTLTSIDPDTVGTLSEGEGGFKTDLWAGTSRWAIDMLMKRLPVDAASGVMRRLMQRLLLTRATIERGQSKPGGLIALRIQMLTGMGDLSGANALLSVTPARYQYPEIARAEADLRLLSNDNARACALAANQIAAQKSVYWQKMFIFCQALAGEKSKAQLGVSLLRELGEKDTVFFSIVDALAEGVTPEIKSLPKPTPLHLAMARVAKAQLPSDVVSSNRPVILRTIAISPNASVKVRLEAAERAEDAGALPTDSLRQLYTSIVFTEEELANPLSKAEAESGPLSRALLYRTAVVQTVPLAKAEAIAKAMDLARQGGRYFSTVRVFAPILKTITPSAELLWFAPEAIRASLILKDEETVRVWFAAVRASALFNKTAKAMMDSLMPLARLSGSYQAQGWKLDDLQAWWDGIKKSDGARDKAALLYTLFESLGDAVPKNVWESLLRGPQRHTVAMPQPAYWHRLQEAADSGRLGEALLLVLVTLGDSGPSEADPIVLSRVMRSLEQIGLAGDARALAVEAAVASGI